MRNYYFNYNQAIVNPFKFKKNAKKKAKRSRLAF